MSTKKRRSNVVMKALLITALASGIAGMQALPAFAYSEDGINNKPLDFTKSFSIYLGDDGEDGANSPNTRTYLYYTPVNKTIEVSSGYDTLEAGQLYVLLDTRDATDGGYDNKYYRKLGDAKSILGGSSSSGLSEEQKTMIKDLIANVDGNQKVSGNQEVTGNGTVGGNQTVKGDSTVNGTSTSKDNHVTNNSTVDGKLTSGSEEVKGNSTIGGSSTVKGDSITEGNTTTNGNSTVKGDLGVEGSTNLKDTTVDGALNVTGNATINGSSTVKGDSITEGNTTTNGNSTIKGDLSVSGNSNLQDTNITGKLTVNGNQEVTGDIYTHGSVVANNAGFNNLAVINGATIGNNTDFVNMKDGNIVATGNITALGNFGVAGNTVLNGDVQMNSNASVKSDLNVGGNGNFAGTLSAQDAYLGGQSVLGRFAQQDQKINKTGAAAAAMAGLHPLEFDEEQKLNFAAATGSYHGSSAIALGMFYRPNEQVMFNLSGSSSGSEHMYTLGASFALDRPSGTHVSSRRALTEKVQQLSKVNEAVIKQSMELQAKNDELQSQIAELRQIVMAMKKSA